MKKLSILFAALCFVVSATAQLKSAQTIIKEACNEAAQQHKNAFIIFHASWCGWCHKMDNSINDTSCRKFFNDNYVIKHITVFETDDKTGLNNAGGKEFLAAHHAAEQGIPAWFIFDASGNLLADSQLRKNGEGFNAEGSNVGCPANETEINYFISVLQKTSHINADDVTAIKKRFVENAQ